MTAPANANRVVLVFPARAENVAVARAALGAVASQLAFSLSEVEELRIAVSEAVTNAVLHAYPTGVEGSVEVQITADAAADRLEVEIRDHGRGIADITRARRPEVSTLPGHLGLGFAFMEAMSDEVAVESTPGEGTTVRLVKRPSRERVEESAQGAASPRP